MTTPPKFKLRKLDSHCLLIPEWIFQMSLSRLLSWLICSRHATTLLLSVLLFTPSTFPMNALVAQQTNPHGEFSYDVVVDGLTKHEWHAYGGDWRRDEQTLVVNAEGPAKAVLTESQRKDFELQVDVKAAADSQAGIIFRAADVGHALDEYRGYYIGLHAGRDRVVWGAANRNWRTLADRPIPVPADQWFHLKVVVRDNHIQAWINQQPWVASRFAKFDGVDDRFDTGLIGLRVLGSRAEFKNLEIRAVPSTVEKPSYTNPVQAGCADPCVLFHDGLYYAYCTYSPDHPTMPRGIRLYTSANLAEWKDEGFVITREKSWGDSRFWAPDIVQKEGEFYLYYAANTRICVAKAPHPQGPFQQIGKVPMEPESIRIDAHVFQDTDGKNYFYYVHFDRGNEIWGGELEDDMVSVKTDTLRRMIQADQPWEQHQARIAEGPAMLKHDGVYYLTYSGSHFENPNYAVGYATSESPLGPWTKYEHNPIMKSTSYAHGTAHHGFTRSPDGRELFIVYHRHFSLTQTEPRAMGIDRVQFVERESGPDILEIHGPTATPQPLPSGVALESSPDRDAK